MTKKRKIVLVSLTSVVVLFLLFIGYHYILYLKATSRMEELSADLDKRIVEWEKKEYKRQPLFGPAVKGNAAEFYQEIESYTLKDDWQGVSDAVYNPLQPISSGGQEFYENNKHLIEIVRKGTRAEVYKSPINLRDGFKVKTPNLLKPMIIGNIMVLQAREFNNAGQTSEAIKELCDIVRLGDDHLYEGSLISAIIGLAISSIGEEEMYRFVISDKLAEPQMNELLGYLKTLIDSYPTMQDTWEGETLIEEAGLLQLARDNGFGFIPAHEIFSFRKKGLWNKVKYLYTNGWINRTTVIDAIDDCLAFNNEIMKTSILTYPQAKEEGEKLTDKIKRLKNPISRLFIYNIVSNISHQDNLTCRKGLYILTALQIYKIRHGAYPETLSALAPEIIPDVPLDPFSNNPFIYRLDKDKKPILYSVWYNLKDDNGEKQGNRYEDFIIVPHLNWGERK